MNNNHVNKVDDNYHICRILGKGAFGSVYLTKDKEGKYYASKVETRSKSDRLISEYKIYVNLHRKGFNTGLPKIYSLIQTPKFNIMVMELLGSCLDKLFEKYDKRFKLSTVLKLGIDMLFTLETMHNAGFIHRDIKPANFLIGHGSNSHKLYITDLGLAKMFMKDGVHQQYSSKKSLVGTLRYVSINTHNGIEQSRRDDLESLGYMLVYFLKGRLPWQGLKKKSGEDQGEIISNVKLCTGLDKLCSNIPDSFKKFIKICRNLKYEETPDYSKLRGLFRETAKLLNIEPEYEWVGEIKSETIDETEVETEHSD